MMWGFASVLASSISYCQFFPPFLSMLGCVCVCSFVFSLSTYCFVCLTVLSLSLFFSLVLVFLYAPCMLCVWETYVWCVRVPCACSLCVCLSFACVTLYLCVVWASVSCPTGPGCDLGFHLLSLRLLQPTVLCSQPTTQQMSPDTAANTHTPTCTQSHMYSMSYTQCVPCICTNMHIHRLTAYVHIRTVYNLTHRHRHI